MEQINKLIKDRLTLEENTNNTNTSTNNLIKTISSESVSPKPTQQPQLINYYKYSDLFHNSNINLNKNPIINDTPLNNYRRQLIIAKLLISELQEKNSTIILEKQQIESQLNEALESIKSLHSDYISLTEKFSLVNKNIKIEQNNIINDNLNENEIINLERKIKEIEEEKNILQIKNEELEQKLNNANDINKMQEEKYNYKILLLTKKLEKQEYEIKEQDNFDMIKYEEEKKD